MAQKKRNIQINVRVVLYYYYYTCSKVGIKCTDAPEFQYSQKLAAQPNSFQCFFKRKIVCLLRMRIGSTTKVERLSTSLIIPVLAVNTNFVLN